MSELKIYKAKMTPERNALVDNLSTYLSTLTPTYTSLTFQQVQLDLEVAIRIDVDQKYVGDKLGNYASLLQDNKTYYFFIIDTKWISSKTVELTLSIDSINTFRNDFTFNKKTNIIREHRARILTTDRYVEQSGEVNTHFVVDKVDEGITPPLMIKDTANKILETGNANQNWYLVYVSDNSSNASKPLSVVLLPKSTTTPYSNGGLGNVTWTKNDVEQGKWYYFLPYDNTGFDASCHSVSISFTSSDVFYCVQLTTSDTWRSYKFKNDGSWDVVWNNIDADIYDITFTTANHCYKYGTTRVYDMNIVVKDGVKTNINAGATGVQYLASIDEIDRSQSNIVKIIELPYLPDDNIKWSGNVIDLTGSKFSLYNRGLVLNNYTSEFERLIAHNYIDDLNYLYEFEEQEDDIYHQERNDALESKLFHSSLYQYKLVYDSFSTTIALERFNRLYNAQPDYRLRFKPSNNLSSDLMFKWEYANTTYNDIADYEKFLSAERNNELGLYTSEYLNYLRTGYNYDRKSKNRTEAQAWVGTGVAIAGAVASAVLGAGTGGISTIATISLGASAINNLSNAISTTADAEQSLQRKLAEYKAQSASVSNTGAVDLLNWYNGNKMWIITYKPTENMRKALCDLFYYCGYATNEQRVPSLNGRYWFNYIQCEPIFNEEANTPYEKYLNDIKTRYNAGVTIYHSHNGEYDWSQQYENWEDFLFD